MEVLSYVLGVVTVLFIILIVAIVYCLVKIYKTDKEMNDLSIRINDFNIYIDNVARDFNDRIDDAVKNIDNRMDTHCNSEKK